MTDDSSCSVWSCPLLPHARSVLHSGRASSSSTSTWQGWAACASIAFALLMMLYYMLASTASCSFGVSWEVYWLWAFIVGMDYSSRWCYSWAPWVFLGRSSALAASFISVWWRWMARGFIYFVAFVLFTVIYYGMTWTTWRSLACASRRLLALPAWLHLLRRLRGPCGALLHDGVGCSELDGWCSLTFSRFVGADAGPLRQSWRRFALGPLRLARVFNYLVAFVPLAVTYCETAWTASSSLAGASWCPLAFSAWLHQLRRLRDPGGALLHDGLGCFKLVGRCSLTLSCFVGTDFGPLWLSRRWFALGPLRLAPGFIYLDAFVPLVVIYYGTAWTTSCSLACASWCPLALPAWLHQLWCLRGPCGALLHDGLGCSELFGWCSSAPSRLVDADDGPLRLSRRWFALGPLRLLPGGGGLKPRTSAMLFYLGGGSLVLLLRRFWELGAPLAVSGTAFPLSATCWATWTAGRDSFWFLGELLAPTSTTLTRSSSTSRDLGCWAPGVAAAGDLSWLVELFCGFGRRFDRL